MGNKKDKQRWLNIQENNRKTCLNCSQLIHDESGQYRCSFSKSKAEFENYKIGGGLIISPSYAKQPHECFNRYNGKNLV